MNGAATPGRIRFALGQFSPRLADVSYNARLMADMVDEAAGMNADVVCFPELAVSGYLLDRDAYHPQLMAAVAQATRELTRRVADCRMGVVVGVPVSAGEALWNSVRLAWPGRPDVDYHKIHMVRHEAAVFTRGATPLVDHGSGLGLACCYDMAFPEHARALALGGAKVIVAPMAWERRRSFVMTRLSAARVIENVCYVVTVNCCGRQGHHDFVGGSAVYDPLGGILTSFGEEEGLRLIDLDLDHIDKLRADPDGHTYPLLADRVLNGHPASR